MNIESRYLFKSFEAIIFVLFGAALCLGANNAFADGDYSKEKHKPSVPGESAKHIKKVLKHSVKMKLDDAQREKIGKIYINVKSEAAAIKAETEVTINGFMALYKQSKVTEEAIRDYSKKMGDLRGRYLLNNLKAMNDVKKLLTAEQREIIHVIYKTHGKGKKEK